MQNENTEEEEDRNERGKEEVEDEVEHEDEDEEEEDIKDTNESGDGDGDIKDNKTIQIAWYQDESTSNIVEMEFIGNTHTGSLSNLENIPTFNTRLAIQYNDFLV